MVRFGEMLCVCCGFNMDERHAAVARPIGPPALYCSIGCKLDFEVPGQVRPEEIRCYLARTASGNRSSSPSEQGGQLTSVGAAASPLQGNLSTGPLEEQSSGPTALSSTVSDASSDDHEKSSHTANPTDDLKALDNESFVLGQLAISIESGSGLTSADESILINELMGLDLSEGSEKARAKASKKMKGSIDQGISTKQQEVVDATCPICMVNQKTHAIWPCLHFLCESCLRKISTIKGKKGKRCPYCRSSFSKVADLRHIFD